MMSAQRTNCVLAISSYECLGNFADGNRGEQYIVQEFQFAQPKFVSQAAIAVSKCKKKMLLHMPKK